MRVRMHIRFLLFSVTIPIVGACLLPEVANAQLFSPGKLIEAHANLDHLDTCTKCHTLGKRSINQNLCLECHRPLRSRLESGAGFHASLEDRNCASCHKDHFGRDFDPVRFDTTAFRHDVVGYQLTGGHSELSCTTCHAESNIAAADVRFFKGSNDRLEETYMGLSPTCVSCHESDSRHKGQFAGNACETCHDETVWNQAPRFDHDATGYRLEGGHTGIACAKCHAPGRAPESSEAIDYTKIRSAQCGSCHEDKHSARMGSKCDSCHRPSGWRRLKSKGFEDEFDHVRTGFKLIGAHGKTSCNACHRPNAEDPDIQIRFRENPSGKKYARPIATDCTSCHRDEHKGEFSGGGAAAECTVCHGSQSWKPSSFDAFRHAEETRFQLAGAHLGTVCSSCHVPDARTGNVRFNIPDRTCYDCHAADNPHGSAAWSSGSASKECSTCHSTQEWAFGTSTFDHSATKFALTGRHEMVSCRSCHANGESGKVVFAGIESSCSSCHGELDPHAGQFTGEPCTTCHDSESFRMRAFDHSRSRFVLDAAHADLACASCHLSERDANSRMFTRFKPLGTACEDCHTSKNE